MIRPHEDRLRFVAESNPFLELGLCMVPRCNRAAEDRHHIWSRTQLGTASNVVRDQVTGNRLPNVAVVCREHHKDLTGRLGGHRARVIWDVEKSLFYWVDDTRVRPLDPQPELPKEVEA